MGFRLSQKSLQRLSLVDPDLRAVVELAAELSKHEFVVVEGIRTAERQADLLRRGRTRVSHSRHQDGMAVDLVPLVNGGLLYDEHLCCDVAHAMYLSGTQLNRTIRWGGCWSTLGDNPRRQMLEYADRKRIAGKKPFLDLVHFEIMEEKK